MSLPGIAVVGSRGHAKVVIDVIERDGRYRIVGLVDSFRPAGEESYGYPVLGTEAVLPELVGRREISGAFIAVGDNWGRHVVLEKLEALVPGLEYVTAIHPSAQVARGADLGRGVVLMAGAIVNSDSRVGEFSVVNTNASLDHDCMMGRFSSLAPGATVGGYVRLGEFTAVAPGATVIDRRTIGPHVVVGAGAVVVSDLPERCVAYGVPARVVRSRRPGDPYISAG